ncbi:hypothetical protein [Mucilaginibacter pedocola]|uniref:Uncharacterized protein n=1 Tax=Mucilaginibacter pedocola TaxID=1792845 RepID=A0A1S9P7S9_9SPHI|nr:hypothetical protein [Mucilaginibacter pedocola]OOQ57004.1 hypothetical protein BC343_15805 [Mucilaginibacter pedocola]
MKNVFIITLLSACLFSCTSPKSKQTTVWTDTYEQKWRYQLDGDMKALLPDDTKRADLIDYMITRLKTELPNGLESIPQDSLTRLARKIGVDYGFAHAKEAIAGETGLTPTLRPWTKEMETMFREAILSNNEGGDLAEKNKACDCFITELKKIYPDSVMLPFPAGVLTKVSAVCMEKLSVNK